MNEAGAMKHAFALVLIALLSGCDQRKPKFSDEQIRAARIVDPGMTEACLDKLKWGGVDAIPEQSDQCFKFDRPRLWRGFWINQFEGSQFCADLADRTCDPNARTYANYIWLEFGSKPPVELGRGGVYEVKFIGRRSIGTGNFGHFGLFRNDIIVDKVISIKQVEPPPKQ